MLWLTFQVDDYLKIWAMANRMPHLECLFIDKEDDDTMPANVLWTSSSSFKLAALKKLMKKKKRRIVLDPDQLCNVL